MKYLSVCSGIGADSLAFADLDWECIGFAETAAFPAAVLAHHYPDIRNYGDINGYQEWELDARPELIIGGTPCQSFSTAGKRAGLDDPRGQLTITYFNLVIGLRPQWFIWENVPGGINTALPRVIDQITEGGYCCAWRVLDALGFGVPQRRRRLFLVGHISDWRRPAAVLFDSQSGARLPQSVHRPDQDAGRTAGGPDSVYTPHGHARRIDAGEYVGTLAKHMGTGGGNVPMVMNPSGSAYGSVHARDHAGPLDHKGGCGGAARMLYAQQRYREHKHKPHASTLRRRTPDMASSDLVDDGGLLRYLTPGECEALQGIPRGWTDIPWRGRQAPKGRRYQAIGNAMCVPVVRWLGERLDNIGV